jgi:uncharacterized protein (TIGR03437 family)
VLFSLSPATAPAQSSALQLTATGTGFTPKNVVTFSGAALPTTYVSPSTLTATIPASALLAAGRASVIVTDSAGTGHSLEQPFQITGPSARPSIQSLTPASVPAGSPPFTLTIDGDGFAASSTAQWNSTPLTTTFVSSTRLSAAVPAALVSGAGAVAITVANSGAASSPAAFTVSIASPTLVSLSPNSVTAGAPSFTLTAYGFNFASGAVVEWNTVPLATTVVSPSQLAATVPAALCTSAASVRITVSNVGSLTSRPSSFTITASTPAASVNAVLNAFSSQPSAAPGSLISIYGSNLSTPVLINGVAAPILYADRAQINAQVPFEIRPGSATLAISGASPITLEIAAAAPGILVDPDTKYAVAQDTAGALINARNPIAAGQYVTLYLTGQGLLDHSLSTGAAAPSEPLARPLAAVTATVAGIAAPISFAGMAPGLIGVLQVNLLIPDVASGDTRLAIAIGGIDANSATLPIR